jgi:glycopeptidolipid biosynthesis protein
VALDLLPEGLPAPAPVRVDLEAPAWIGEAGSRTSYRALAASVRAEIQEAGLAPGQGTLIAGSSVAAVLHDAMSVWAAGGAVVLPDLPEQGDAEALWALAETRQAVRAYVTVDAVRELVGPEIAARRPLPGLREVVVEHGPALPAELIAGLDSRRPGWRLYERLVSPGGLPVLHRWTPSPGRPRSRPLPAVAVRILDGRFAGVPIGIPGSVVLAEHEAAAAPGHTGLPAGMQDLGIAGRWLDDGAVQLLGRSAARLRVRGYEVDRDLVEPLLRRVAGVREATLTAVHDELGALVEGACDEAEARAQLNQRLPAFMVPAVVARVTRLPRTESGEVDRLNLPAGTPRQDETAARTDFEKLVVTAFAAALGWETVGVHEDFLALGGHCREANSIAATLAEALGIGVDATDVFFYSRAEDLAIALAQRSLAAGEDAERLLAEIEALDDGEAQNLLAAEEAAFSPLP